MSKDQRNKTTNRKDAFMKGDAKYNRVVKLMKELNPFNLTRLQAEIKMSLKAVGDDAPDDAQTFLMYETSTGGPVLVEAKQHSPAEVVQIADETRNNRDALWNDVVNLVLYILGMELLIKDIDVQAAVFRGDEWAGRITDDDGGELYKRLVKIAFVADRWGVDISFITQRVTSRVDAIRMLLNEGDEGQELRKIIASEGGKLETVAGWRDALKLAGRQEGATEDPIDYLCQQLVEIRINQCVGRVKAFELLYAELEAHHDTVDTMKAWTKIQKYQQGDIMSLWRAVSNRPALREILKSFETLAKCP